jgi:hypothetical protein
MIKLPDMPQTRMGAMDAIATRVAAGTTVEFRPAGSSMVASIRSRQLVTVAPVDPNPGRGWRHRPCPRRRLGLLHLVSAVDVSIGRVQISNNRGRINGWTNHARIHGICTAVDRAPRPRIDGKATG